jgi:hypothetical protein
MMLIKEDIADFYIRMDNSFRNCFFSPFLSIDQATKETGW